MFKRKDEEDDEEAQDETAMSLVVGTTVLGVATICCAANGEFLIQAISGTVESWNISKSFIGIILLPIIGEERRNIRASLVVRKIM